MLILRIRQAECALADGRLDEAFELADRHDVRSHRRGQRLVGRLVRSLAERGRKHLAAGRLAEAAADSEKARRFGGMMPEVAELRNKTAEALLTHHRAERAQARLVAAARDQIDRGHLSAGGQILAAVAEQDSAAGEIRRDLAARRETARDAVTRARDALGRDDWQAAAKQLARVRPADAAADTAYIALAAQIATLARERIQTALDRGDVRLAGALLDRLLPVDGEAVETQHLRQAVAQCRLAWDHLDRCQPRQAAEITRRLASLLPGAKWVPNVARQLQQAAELMDELRAGPLSLCAVGSMDETIAQPARPPHPAPPPIPAGNGHALHFARATPTPPPIPQVNTPSGEALPSRFVLQVDGAGSYLVLTQPRVTIGPVNSSRAPDVGLMTDASAASATIERVEEDYFLRPAGPMAVNGRACAGKLLTSGDELGLSPRCRLTFRQPSAASTSAVLDLTGTRVPRADVRRVILLDRELVIGPGVGAHVRADELTDKVVLVVRDGRMFVQTAQPILVADREIAPRSAVPMGQHVKAGPVSFVATVS